MAENKITCSDELLDYFLLNPPKFKYNIGDQVWLHHTQEKAVVADFVDMYMLLVTMQGMQVPVFIEDLELYINQDNKSEHHTADTKVVMDEAEFFFQKYGNEIATGFYLSFLPVTNEDEQTFFEMILVNDTNDDVLFDVQLFLGGEKYMHLKNRLQRRYMYRMGDLAFDELNENPELKILVEHSSHPLFQLSKDFKIRPKNFFKDLSSTPILNDSAYNFKLGFLLETAALQNQAVSITTSLATKMQTRMAANYQAVVPKKHEHFYVPDVVDLHIEQLIDKHTGMSNAEIIKIQLSHCRQALELAIVHRLEKITFIHGIGKGKLRQEIWTLLRQYPAVRSFQNDYHPRYGFGATEIYLR